MSQQFAQSKPAIAGFMRPAEDHPRWAYIVPLIFYGMAITIWLVAGFYIYIAIALGALINLPRILQPVMFLSILIAFLYALWRLVRGAFMCLTRIILGPRTTRHQQEDGEAEESVGLMDA